MLTLEPDALLKELDRAGVRLWVEGEQLHFRSPPGALSTEHTAAIRRMKAQIVELVRNRDPLPNSHPQAIIWRPSEIQLDMLDAPLNTIPSALLWRGDLDLASFQSALQQLLARQSTLRTRFARDAEGGTWAVTEPQVAVPIETIDVRELPPEAREQEAYRAGIAFISKGFDVETGPLIRVAILRLEESVSYFVFLTHHSISDFISGQILIAEFAALYGAALAGEAPRLLPLPTEFRDLVEQERTRLEVSAAQTLEYWRGLIAGASTIFRLPYDRSTPVEHTDDLPLINGQVSQAVLRRLRSLAQQHRTTLFLVVTTMIAVVLRHWTEHPDVAFWTCDHGRRSPESHGMIGCFVNYWPLRVDLSGDICLDEALRRVHAVYTASLPHSRITRRRLKPELDAVRNGQFFPGCTLNFLSKGLSQWDESQYGSAAPINIQRSGRIAEGAPFVLQLWMVESPLGLEWLIFHSSHAFEETTIERLSAALAAALEGASANPGLPLREAIPWGIRAPSAATA